MLCAYDTHTKYDSERGKRKLWEAMNMSVAVMVVMVSQVHTCPKLNEFYILNMYCFHMPIILQKSGWKNKIKIKCGSVPIKLYFQKQIVGRFSSMGYSELFLGLYVCVQMD